MKRTNKKLFISLLTFCIAFIPLIGSIFAVPERVYAVTEEDWESLSSSDELVNAFRSYCKSRDLTVEGSVADAVTSVTSDVFFKVTNKLGLDITQVQASIKKYTPDNLGTRFLFTQTGVNFYNQIFAQLLLDYELSVGETDVNKTIKSGEYLKDAEGYGAFVYKINRNTSQFNTSNVTAYGSVYKYTSSDYMGILPIGSTDSSPYSRFGDTTYNFSCRSSTSTYNGYKHDYYRFSGSNGSVEWQQIFEGSRLYSQDAGDVIIFKTTGGSYYIGAYLINSRSAGNNEWKAIAGPISFSSDDIDDTSVNIVSPRIKDPLADDQPLQILPDGTVTNNTLPDDGGNNNDPGGGDDPDDWQPSTPTIPDPSSPGDNIVDLPDIDIPDLPSLNFSLGDLREKFPFSLPFDIIAVLSVLDGEPQAPHIQATVPIGSWYTWEMDFDFSEFDNYARIFRIFEFIGFCIGLAVFTVHFVKG